MSSGQIPIRVLFCKSATSVAQVVSMALIGLAFKKVGVVDANAQKVISQLSMKCMIPCLLFSSVITCPQLPSLPPGSCPELAKTLQIAWPFLLLPFLWVGVGLLVGQLATVVSRTPRPLRSTAISACAFGNSTGLPLTLLHAIAQAGVMSSGSENTSRNFLMLLSIYQISYPILQWSIAGSLLRKPADHEEPAKAESNWPWPGPGSPQEALMREQPLGDLPSHDSSSELSIEDSSSKSVGPSAKQTLRTRLLDCSCAKFVGVLEAILVPPVIAVLLGVAVGLSPWVRGLLIDTRDFDDDSYFEFAFDAIESFAKAAVPLNMLILGASMASIPDLSAIHWPTTLAVIFGKLILCPAIAVTLVLLFFRTNLVPDFQSAGFGKDEVILVALIVTSTPTANNLAVLAELSGGAQCKQALSAMVFLMYCVAPFLLTAWIVAFIELGKQ